MEVAQRHTLPTGTSATAERSRPQHLGGTRLPGRGAIRGGLGSLRMPQAGQQQARVETTAQRQQDWRRLLPLPGTHRFHQLLHQLRLLERRCQRGFRWVVGTDDAPSTRTGFDSFQWAEIAHAGQRCVTEYAVTDVQVVGQSTFVPHWRFAGPQVIRTCSPATRTEIDKAWAQAQPVVRGWQRRGVGGGGHARAKTGRKARSLSRNIGRV